MRKNKGFGRWALAFLSLAVTCILTVCTMDELEDLRREAEDLNNPNCTVTFVDGDVEIEVSVKKGKPVEMPTNPGKTNNTFSWWYTSAPANPVNHTGDPTAPVVPWDFSKPVTKDMKLHAGWNVQGTYTVVFFSNKGTSEFVLVPGAGALGTAMPPDPVRPGYVFAEWNTKAEGTSGTTFTGATPVTESKAVYARWEQTSGADVINIAAILGVIPPVPGNAPVSAITATAQ
jgi:uncharacterized repeat protein (TIGR02543 family)